MEGKNILNVKIKIDARPIMHQLVINAIYL